MSGYTEAEEAVRQALIATDGLDLLEETCTIDLDTMFPNLLKSNLKVGCVLSFAGGSRPPREPFQMGSNKGLIWRWRCFGVMFIRYQGNAMETEVLMREVVEELKTFLSENPRLDGAADYAYILNIDAPEPMDISDISFFLLGFTIEIWEKL